MLPVSQGSDISDYGDGYGSDLMGDEEDRAMLMAMNELDREMILAERSEARDREREKRRTAQLLKQRQREIDQVNLSRNFRASQLACTGIRLVDAGMGALHFLLD